MSGTSVRTNEQERRESVDDWIRHPQTGSMRDMLARELTQSAYELSSACMTSTDPKVASAWAAHEGLKKTMELFMTGKR